MISKWRFIRRKILLDHSRITIMEDTVKLPNGKEIKYVLEAPSEKHSVAIIALKDNNILLQKEFSYPPNKVMYQLPGGSANDSEDITQTANRELSEESGYISKDCKIIGYFYLNNRRSNKKQYVVLCKDLVTQKLPEDKEEFIESIWIPLEKVDQLIRENKITNIGLLAALRLLDANQQ